MLVRLKKFALLSLTLLTALIMRFPASAAGIIPPATADNINPGTYILLCAVLLAVVVVLIIFSLKNRKK